MLRKGKHLPSPKAWRFLSISTCDVRSLGQHAWPLSPESAISSTTARRYVAALDKEPRLFAL
jgi:hypothetical protein